MDFLVAYANKGQYNERRYNDYLKTVELGNAAFNEFLPVEEIEDSVIIRLGVPNKQPRNFRIANEHLYMLKNELLDGAYYGFAYTDTINILEGIIAEKPNWFGRALNLSLKTQVLANSSALVKVLDATFATDAEAQRFLNEISELNNAISKTHTTMKNWVKAFGNKRSYQFTMRRFGDYVYHILDDHHFEVMGEGKTPYHYFHYITRSNSFDELLSHTITYNFNMERLVFGFEEFFLSFNTEKMDIGELSLSNRVIREVSLG